MAWTNLKLYVLNEEWRCAHVVDGAVEVAEALLRVQIHRDDVVEPALRQHLRQELQADVTAPSHLGFKKLISSGLV